MADSKIDETPPNTPTAVIHANEKNTSKKRGPTHTLINDISQVAGIFIEERPATEAEKVRVGGCRQFSDPNFATVLHRVRLTNPSTMTSL